jgi:hypothetical protein
MAGNQFGGGNDKFRVADKALQRQVVQMGAPQVLQMPIDKNAQGGVPVAQPIHAIPQAVIGKGADGVRGASPIRVVGSSPFGHEMGSPAPAAPAQFQPMPQPVVPAAAPVQRGPELGAGEEVHTLVATLKGPDGRMYEAPWEVVAPRGSQVMGVTERS